MGESAGARAGGVGVVGGGGGFADEVRRGGLLSVRRHHSGDEILSLLSLLLP